MTIRDFEVHAEYGLYGNEVRLWLHKSHQGHSDVMLPINPTIMRRENGLVSAPSDPSIMIDMQQARVLMAALWKIGVRPIGVTDDNERVLLLKEHIKSLEGFIETLKGQLTNLDAHLDTQSEILKGAQEIILDVAPQRRPAPQGDAFGIDRTLRA